MRTCLDTYLEPIFMIFPPLEPGVKPMWWQRDAIIAYNLSHDAIRSQAILINVVIPFSPKFWCHEGVQLCMPCLLLLWRETNAILKPWSANISRLQTPKKESGGKLDTILQPDTWGHTRAMFGAVVDLTEPCRAAITALPRGPGVYCPSRRSIDVVFFFLCPSQETNMVNLKLWSRDVS